MSLAGKVIVITGASSGIGEATAYAFARQGCCLSLAARNLEGLERVKRKCENLGAETLIVQCDVSREDDCRQLITSTLARFRTLHVLINNAGVSMRALFADLHLDTLRKVMDVNFWGTVYCTKFALPEIVKNAGSVISISSVAGFKGLPARTGYSASKFAILGFMEALRIENRKTGLHVGVICPGYTASNIRNTALNAQGQSQDESPLDESRLMPASSVADEIVKCVQQRKAELILTTQGKLTYWLNKFFPRWVDSKVFDVISREKDSPFH